MNDRAPAVRLRAARSGDGPAIHAIANDPVVRAASFSPAPIPPAAHRRWFETRLADPDAVIHVVVDAADRVIGYVRLERAAREWTVSIALEADHRYRGLAPGLIAAAAAGHRSRHARDRIRAYVRKDNPPSQRAFVKAGFGACGETRVNDVEALCYEFAGEQGA